MRAEARGPLCLCSPEPSLHLQPSLPPDAWLRAWWSPSARSAGAQRPAGALSSEGVPLPRAVAAQVCSILEPTRRFPASGRFPFRITRKHPRSTRAPAALNMVKSKTEKDIFAFGQTRVLGG